MVERVFLMEPRKDSYVPIYYAECRYDKPILLKGSMNGITVTGLEHGKFRHLIDRRPKIDYLETHDDDITKIIKEILRIENEKYEERQKNERNDSTSGDN